MASSIPEKQKMVQEQQSWVCLSPYYSVFIPNHICVYLHAIPKYRSAIYCFHFFFLPVFWLFLFTRKSLCFSEHSQHWTSNKKWLRFHKGKLQFVSVSLAVCWWFDHIGYVLGSCYWLLNYLLCKWLTSLYSRSSLTLGMMISCGSGLKFCWPWKWLKTKNVHCLFHGTV